MKKKLILLCSFISIMILTQIATDITIPINQVRAQSSYTNEIAASTVVCTLCGCQVDDDGNCCCSVHVCACDECHETITCNEPCPYCSGPDPFDGYDPFNGYDPWGDQEEDDPYYSSVDHLAYDYSGNYTGGYWGFGYAGFSYYVPVNNLPTGTLTMQSATRILANSSINPARGHQSGVVDNANARQNLIDTSNGENAKRSSYTHEGRTGPGGEVALSTSLLNGIESLAAGFDIDISEIAGGVHSTTSSHYNGNTMDVNYVDGIHVSNMRSSACQSFEQGCRDAGATYILKEKSHYHIKF